MLAVRSCRNTRRIYARAVYNRSNMIQRGGTSTFLDIVPFSSIAIHNYLCSLFSTVCYSISFSFKRSFIQNAKSMNVILGGSCRLRVTDASYAQLFVTAYLRSRFYKRAYAKNILHPTVQTDVHHFCIRRVNCSILFRTTACLEISSALHK